MEDQNIIQAALEKCMSIYDEAAEMTSSLPEDNSFLGNPPRAMLIKYGEGGLRKNRISTDRYQKNMVL